MRGWAWLRGVVRPTTAIGVLRRRIEDGEAEAALPEVRAWLRYHEFVNGPQSLETVVALELLARGLIANDEHTEARPLLERAAGIVRRIEGHDTRLLSVLEWKLADVCLEALDATAACRHYDTALKVLGEAPDIPDATLAQLFLDLGRARARVRDDAGALSALAESIRLNEAAHGKGSLEAALARVQYALALRGAGKVVAAQREFAAAFKVLWRFKETGRLPEWVLQAEREFDAATVDEIRKIAEREAAERDGGDAAPDLN